MHFMNLPLSMPFAEMTCAPLGPVVISGSGSNVSYAALAYRFELIAAHVVAFSPRAPGGSGADIYVCVSDAQARYQTIGKITLILTE